MTPELEPYCGRTAGADKISLAVAIQKPLGLDSCDCEETEEDQAGNVDAGFVIRPSPGGDLQSFGQERPAMFAIHREANFTQTVGQ